MAKLLCVVEFGGSPDFEVQLSAARHNVLNRTLGQQTLPKDIEVTTGIGFLLELPKDTLLYSKLCSSAHDDHRSVRIYEIAEASNSVVIPGAPRRG